jgi:hypothetical protein
VKPGDPQMLDRYSYVRNNPLSYIDPSGLHLAIVCGTGQECEGGNVNAGTIESYRLFVQMYWLLYEGVSAEALEAKWALFSAYVAFGHSPDEQLAAGAVAFLSTAEAEPKALSHSSYVDKLANIVQRHAEIDTLIGFSLGGHVVGEFLAGYGGGAVRQALLIESADAWLGTPLGGSPSGVRVVTWNGTDPNVYVGIGPFKVGLNMTGLVPGTPNITTGECRKGHCSHGNTPAYVKYALLMLGDLAGPPPEGLSVSYTQPVFPPEPVPVP